MDFRPLIQVKSQTIMPLLNFVIDVDPLRQNAQGKRIFGIHVFIKACLILLPLLLRLNALLSSIKRAGKN